MNMKRQQALLILSSLPEKCPEPHPYAKEGTQYDMKRANDKVIGTPYSHYFMRNTLYYVGRKDK